MTFGNKLFTSSINATKVQRVLDVGTGTGIWAIDYGICYLLEIHCKKSYLCVHTADSHPQAEVLPFEPSRKVHTDQI